MPTFAETKAGYHNLWNVAHITDARKAAATALAQKICSEPYRSTFKQVETATGVPWFLVGCLLERESSLDLGTYLGNGEKLSQVTHLVPAGRGPFHDFQSGAVDALKYEGMTGISPADWTVERMLYWAERFNGEGYFSHGINSPYVWSWTDQYSRGKYSSDGNFDASLVDPQPGVAAMLKALAEVSTEVASRISNQEVVPVTDQSHPAPTAAPGFHLPHIPFAEMEQWAETTGKMIPWLRLVPVPIAQQAADVLAGALPVTEGLLTLLDKAQTALEKGGSVIQVIDENGPAVWAQLKTVHIPSLTPPKT